MSNIKEIEKKIEGKKWEDALDKAYQKANQKIKIDGFRKGKAPKNIFIKKYGKKSLWLDATDLVLEDAYKEMLEEEKETLTKLVAQPDVAIKNVDEDGLTLLFTLTLRPKVKLGKYKDLNIKKENANVSKKEIENTINEMRQKYAESILKEGKIEKGDTAIIDFEGYIDGVAFEGGKGENYPLTIGSGTFIPGFEDQLIGLKAGDEKDVIVTFPKDYNAEHLRNKEATFKVKVEEVKEIIIPELDEEFFADLGMDGVDSKETLEATISDNILKHKENEIQNKFIDNALKEALKNVEVDIPDVMIEEELDRLIKQFEDGVKSQGLDMKIFYAITKSNEEQLRTQMRDNATEKVKERLMLEEIAKVEKIEVTNEQAEEYAEELAKKYEMEKDEFIKLIGGLEMVKYDKKMREATKIILGEN